MRRQQIRFARSMHASEPKNGVYVLVSAQVHVLSPASPYPGRPPQDAPVATCGAGRYAKGSCAFGELVKASVRVSVGETDVSMAITSTPRCGAGRAGGAVTASAFLLEFGRGQGPAAGGGPPYICRQATSSAPIAKYRLPRSPLEILDDLHRYHH